MPEISVDASFAPELVEFWGLRYKQIKEELENLKALNAVRADREGFVQGHHGKLEDLIQLLQTENAKRQAGDKVFLDVIASSKKDEVAMRDKWMAAEQEKNELLVRLANIEAERLSLSKQVQVVHSQALAFATEADQRRREIISEMFPPVSFVDDTFQSALLFFSQPQAITRALPAHIANTTRIYFLPRPPSCMPLRIPACAQPGYWFYPAWIADDQFELIVEGRAGEWSYLGRYVSALFPNHEMKLSEWMTLDEQTKLSHSARVASQNLPPGQIASYPAQLDVKRRYELGEWSVPCYTLRCVGFNMVLYDALHTAAAEVAGPVLGPTKGPQGEPTTTPSQKNAEVGSAPGKRPRADTIRWLGVTTEKDGYSAKKARPAAAAAATRVPVHASETNNTPSEDNERDVKAA